MRYFLLFLLILTLNLKCGGLKSSFKPKEITYSGKQFVEASTNNGSFTQTITITSKPTFSISSGNLTQNTHYELSGTGLPTGLTLVATVNSSTTATLSISGSSLLHSISQSVSNLKITFLNSAFSSLSAPTDGSASLNFSIFFITYPIVFFSTGSIESDFNGREGADSRCQQSKPSTVGQNKIRALISISSEDSINQMPSNYDIPTNLSIGSVNETPLASDWSSLINSGPSVDFSSAGVVSGTLLWWSGSGASAEALSGSTCNNWTSNEANQFGAVGSTLYTTSWIFYPPSSSCNKKADLICIAFQ